MEDVAREAGVDRSTVSRALRRDPWIPRHTRDRIEAAAARLGYVRSGIASELAGMRSRTIGACLPRAGGDAFYGQLNGLVDAAAPYRLKVLTALYAPGQEQECVRDFHERRVAGIVIFGTTTPGSYSGVTPRGLCPVVEATPFDPSCHRSQAALGRQIFEDLADLLPDLSTYSRYRSR